MNLRSTAPLLAAISLISLASVARAADVEVGQPAPEFSLPDQTGKVHKLADYRGKTVVLAFYPKASTAG